MQNTQDGRVQPSPIDAERVLRQTFVASVECHGTVDSTNDRAKQCWTEGREPLPLLVTAERQSAGRGRGTNRWWTGEGSLAFSLLLELRPWAIDRNGEPMTALVAGIATAEALAPLLPQGTVGIHWPNDIFAAGRKVAGILTEAPRPGTHVIGIGINTNTSLVEAPVELQRKAATLLDLTGSRHDHTEILIRLLQNLEYLLDRLGRQPQAIAAHADSLCLQRGKSLTLDMGQEFDHRNLLRCCGRWRPAAGDLPREKGVLQRRGALMASRCRERPLCRSTNHHKGRPAFVATRPRFAASSCAGTPRRAFPTEVQRGFPWGRAGRYGLFGASTGSVLVASAPSRS